MACGYGACYGCAVEIDGEPGGASASRGRYSPGRPGSGRTAPERSGCLDALTAPDVARSLDVFVTKTVTPLPRDGNAPLRIAETDVGMLNSIGLANPGIDGSSATTLPRLARLGPPVWVSVGGFAAADYAEMLRTPRDHDAVAAIELNVSCPNVDPSEDGGGGGRRRPPALRRRSRST